MSDKKNIGLSSRKVLGWTIAGTIIGFAGGALLIWLYDANLDDKAQFGDSMNVLTALFSALAFAAVAVSLWYQHREVAATLEEMKVSNETQEKSLERQASIAKAMSIQSFVMYRPYIVVRLDFYSDEYLLTVENLGKTAAIDLQLEVSDKEITDSNDALSMEGYLSHLPLFVNGAESFSPRQRVQYRIGHRSELSGANSKLPLPFVVTATYRSDFEEKPIKERTVCNIVDFRKSVIFRSNPSKSRSVSGSGETWREL